MRDFGKRGTLVPLKLVTPFNELPRGDFRVGSVWPAGPRIRRFLHQAFVYNSHKGAQLAVRARIGTRVTINILLETNEFRQR
jgi:hypothetical protein